MPMEVLPGYTRRDWLILLPVLLLLAWLFTVLPMG